MPGDEIAGLSVVVSAEVQQAMKALDGMSRQFEETSLVAQQSTEVQEASFVDVEHGMGSNLKAHEKHSAGVMGSLKKIGMVWTAITGAAIGAVYGMLKASSYGSLYFSQWGAIMKDVMNTAIRPIIPLLNDFINTFKKLAEIFKKVSGEENLLVGFFAAISLGISELWDWIGDLDLKWQILIGVFAAVVLAGVSLVLIFTGTFGIAIAIGVVIAVIWTFRDEIGWLIDKLVGAAGAAKDFVDKGLKYIVTYLSDLTWPTISNPFDLDYLSGVADWVLSVLGLGDHSWDISWPTISNPFAGITWCDLIPRWVASVLGICEDKAEAPVITWPEIPDPFAGVFDTITDFAADAADVGGTLIDNLISGIGAGLPSLADAVSGITDTLSGGGAGDGGGEGGGGGGGEGGGVDPELAAAALESVGAGAYDTYVDWNKLNDWFSTVFPTIDSFSNYHNESQQWAQDNGYSWFAVGSEDLGLDKLMYFWTDNGRLIPSAWAAMNLHGYGNYPQGSYAQGGYISHDQVANIHGGEYVIPKGGALVKEGGMPDVTINLTVNNGTQKDSRVLADEISRILATEIRRMVKT